MKNREELRLRVPGYMNVWANDAEVHHSHWDFRITFGQIQEASKQKLAIDGYVTVAMSPQFMKRLMGTLQDSVAAYENAYGLIPSRVEKGPK